jgi:trans-aconitate 2-methyltransferase
MSWDPDQYLAFEAERIRPALDLIARIPLDAPRLVFDLGCGPGNVTLRLARRWPGARVVGLDSSAAMLARARVAAPALAFEEADLERWAVEPGADLLFSNAVLQWLPDPTAALVRWLGALGPGAVLAVQIPRNADAPFRLAIAAAEAAAPWHGRPGARWEPRRVAGPSTLYRALAPLARELDIWETEYLHVFRGRDPILEFVKGTALRPLLDILNEDERKAFLASVAERLRAAHPVESDGATLFPFRRLFLIARR